MQHARSKPIPNLTYDGGGKEKGEAGLSKKEENADTQLPFKNKANRLFIVVRTNKGIKYILNPIAT